MTSVVFSVEANNCVLTETPATIAFSIVHCDDGGGWIEPSTFRAPVGGLYHLQLTATRAADDGGEARLWLRRDGQNVTSIVLHPATGSAFTIALPVSAGQTLDTRIDAGGDGCEISTVHFTGVLIAPVIAIH